MDNTKKFMNKADKYVSSRPSYPTKLMDYLYNEVGFSDKSKIADIGAGTGIFTRQLLERDSDVRCLHHILVSSPLAFHPLARYIGCLERI